MPSQMIAEVSLQLVLRKLQDIFSICRILIVALLAEIVRITLYRTFCCPSRNTGEGERYVCIYRSSAIGVRRASEALFLSGSDSSKVA